MNPSSTRDGASRGSSGESVPRDAGRVLLHVGAAATVAPVPRPLATGSWRTLLSELPLTGSPIIIPRDVSECAAVCVEWALQWGRGGWEDRQGGRGRSSGQGCPWAVSVRPGAGAGPGAGGHVRTSQSPVLVPQPAGGSTQEGEVSVHRHPTWRKQQLPSKQISLPASIRARYSRRRSPRPTESNQKLPSKQTRHKLACGMY